MTVISVYEEVMMGKRLLRADIRSHLIAYPGVANGVRGAGRTLLVDLAGSCSEC